MWAGKFNITDTDLDYLTNLLLERETPLSLETLALALIEKRLNDEAEKARKRYENILLYRPSETYSLGQRLVFPALDYAMATVTREREGFNPDSGDFTVIGVAFDDDEDHEREFASGLAVEHKLNEVDESNVAMPGIEQQSAEEILAEHGDKILASLRQRLQNNDDLISVAGKWFSRSLVLDVNEGHLNLAEAVLDIMGGGPLSPVEILEQIGSIGNGPAELQVYSLNYAMMHDSRFDEVGPVGQVLWYLTRLEPDEVKQVPHILRYTAIEYDPTLLTNEMEALVAELDDELSQIEPEQPRDLEEATIALIYPHRRAGTLPLNAKIRAVFPTALRTSRVWVTLVDGQDGEESVGWVVRDQRYVYGLNNLYRKHMLPVGAYVTVRRGDRDDHIVTDFRSHRPRTEWVKLITPKNNQLGFDEQKRAIGAEYDDLLILGTDDIAGVDAMGDQARQQKRPLASIIRIILAELARFSPQSAVHAKTIYSAVNVLRRCPPGPILATLVSNPDFEYVGNHYWKISER